MNTNTVIGVIVVLIIVGLAGIYYMEGFSRESRPLDATPRSVTLSGTYTCLPHLDTTGPQTEECAFGIQTDDGEYYAVNFGQSEDSMDQFQSGAHINAEGFVVIKEALSTDHWQKYNMKGIFTVTRMLEAPTTTVPTGSSGKIDINAVCEGALIYMTFPDGTAAEKFVAECKEGKHPEVLEQYQAQLNLDGATI